MRHLVEVTLRHYDPELRSQAAATVGEVAKLNSPDKLAALIDGQVSLQCGGHRLRVLTA